MTLNAVGWHAIIIKSEITMSLALLKEVISLAFRVPYISWVAGLLVMTMCDYDSDTFSFSLSSLTLTTPAPLLHCTITYLVTPLFSFCLLPCTLITALPCAA